MRRAELIQALNGMLKIAKLAMPDTYYQTDTRCMAARGLVQRLKDREEIHDRT